MRLEEIIGQEKVKNELRRAFELDRLPHAMLLTGPSGSGLLPVSLLIARMLLCEGSANGGDNCEACKKVDRLMHPDLHFTYPVAGSDVLSSDYAGTWRQALLDNPYISVQDWMRLAGLEKKKPNISVRECKEIMHRLSLKAFEGKHKVYIIWGAEFLGKEGNRLLKLIEEPAPGTYIILIAEQLEYILPTILSRCQLIKLSPLGDEEIKSALMDKLDMDEDGSASAAFMANGDFNKALMVGVNRDTAIEDLWDQWMKTVAKKDIKARVEVAELLARLSKDQQELFFEYGDHFLSQLIHAQYIPAHALRLADTQRSLAERLASFMDMEGIELMKRLFDEYVMYLRRNGNARIVFMDLSIKAHHVIADIVKRRKQVA